ncbi:MAG TPA: CBS domain-containing protein [Clostridia bacterium]|nr:CBS domain-containing protein [Clostridia bacterium]
MILEKIIKNNISYIIVVSAGDTPEILGIITRTDLITVLNELEKEE